MSRALLAAALAACFVALSAGAADPAPHDAAVEALEKSLEKGGITSSFESVVSHAKLTAEMARDMLVGGGQRRKGGGKASGGGSKSSSGGSSWGGSSSGSKTSNTGVSKTGKTTYNNPTPVSTSSRTGTYRTATATGRTPTAGARTGPTRPFTSTGAAAASSFRASPVSYSSSYGTRSSSGIRPFYIFAGAAAAGALMGSRRGCSGDRYRFGNSCRQCSTDACPIGQYRTPCDSYNDGYCTACTGLASGRYWVTPGNGDNCQSEPCTIDSPCALCPTNTECPAVSTTPATASFFVETPVTLSQWNADSGVAVKESIASAASPAGVTSSRITYSAVDEATLDPADVQAGMARRRRWEAAATQARKLLQSDAPTATQEDPGVPTPVGTHGRRLLQNATEAAATTTTATAAPATTPAPAAEGCGAAPPDHDKYVVAVVDIATTEDKIEQLWQQLTEMNLNVALSGRCAPPASLGYFGAASSLRVSLLGTLLASVLALSVSMFQE
eukprot:CAMPEP_0173414414 /NCGR_PEP_ID=MMETSP1356-20130122/84316_1 /TAXON_ID=77927 ORGANISM="Hemiselmis virescens, Strain PCC157" /NCGR_SAMPLE_ID=MMETSP1356 /ASSEMBLY_ACC=CAM_ASM_000847 /LENGTH=500 /DNA_ID=CAMNT_0014376597 /DNA_START=53 /DNA_END=1555 /DNA_ORIENTATION=-